MEKTEGAQERKRKMKDDIRKKLLRSVHRSLLAVYTKRQL
jgi:hypothetical protein